jgi:hypothetical protein
MLKFLITLTVLMTATVAQAAYSRLQNIKLPSQSVLEHRIVTPLASSTAAILNGHAGATSATPVTVTSFIAQPDVARNIVVTPGGTTADVKAGDVVVTGRDEKGNSISEAFTFADNASAAVTGNKAFKTVTSILFPAEDSPYGATWKVGTGDKLGLRNCLAGDGYVIKGLVDGSVLTGITVAANSSVASLNTFIPNPASNGSRVFDVMYIQNFLCP